MSKKVKIGKRGIITLPAELRKKYGLQEEDDLIVEETGEGLLLRPTVNLPIEIFTEERIAEFMEDDEELGRVLDRIKAAREESP
ncbi:AbrB/MazE/SpoVT family DNA-binding domain-containing protein [Puniceicoccales bacterium CK1056]|uniref:AbrB/MazE/SpoVT family DNA-binding domain-containing protein n=1 Tax=Oceanipulchritudo coccoides TaxID=2706888 RepID=A0A6B2M1P7_9BACT|nr:AbrB/MazE/SpoVT family DNA-binding domain-containing protein [Oceanipulchritudo coccoides]NDV61715.1 AbrB/MazE/SpoVT family DNA-binding domain-containing protein [Oceanipulchritudo coccoides]